MHPISTYLSNEVVPQFQATTWGSIYSQFDPKDCTWINMIKSLLKYRYFFQLIFCLCSSNHSSPWVLTYQLNHLTCSTCLQWCNNEPWSRPLLSLLIKVYGVNIMQSVTADLDICIYTTMLGYKFRGSGESLITIYELLNPIALKIAHLYERYAYFNEWGTYFVVTLKLELLDLKACRCFSNDPLGAVSIRKTVLPGMAIPMLKIRRPNGRLIFYMEIAIRR